MGFNRLPTEQMIEITRPWIDPSKDRGLIEAIDRARGLLPLIEEVHRGLLRAQPPEDTSHPELLEIRRATVAADQIHDRKTRGTSYVLEGLAELTDDPAEAQRLEELQARLLNRGLSVVKLAPAAEAGEVELAEERLTAADRELLARLPGPGGTTLLQAHEARVVAGRELGELARRKATLSSRPAAAATAPTPADALRARNAWIRTVKVLVSALELQPLPDATRKQLLGPLQEAILKLLRRAPAAPAPTAPTAPVIPA
jgi:hypothetical protein